MGSSYQRQVKTEEDKTTKTNTSNILVCSFIKFHLSVIMF